MGDKETDYESNLQATSKPRMTMIIVAILITTLVLDISLLRVYDSISKEFTSIDSKVVIFSAITMTCLASEFLLLRTLRVPQKADLGEFRSILRFSYRVSIIVLIVVAAMIIFVVLQIIALSYYDTSAVLVAILLSYGLCITILGVFIGRITPWLSPERSKLVVILLVIALATIIFNAVIAMIDVSLRLGDRPPETRPSLSASIDVSKGRYDSLDLSYFVSYIVSYLITWIGTANLLHHYSKRIGKLKYSLLLAGPLAFFLLQFSGTFLNMISPVTGINQFLLANLVTLVVSFSKPVGGLMLAIGFWTIARLAKRDSRSRFYLVISGIGMLLLFTSNQAILISIAPYPPFGLATISVMGLSSYLILLGVYTSSVSISNDDRLRRKIRQATYSEAKLIEGFISAEKRKEIETKVIAITKKHFADIAGETGAKPTMTDDEIKEYFDDYMEEVKDRK